MSESYEIYEFEWDDGIYFYFEHIRKIDRIVKVIEKYNIAVLEESIDTWDTNNGVVSKINRYKFNDFKFQLIDHENLGIGLRLPIERDRDQDREKYKLLRTISSQIVDIMNAEHEQWIKEFNKQAEQDIERINKVRGILYFHGMYGYFHFFDKIKEFFEAIHSLNSYKIKIGTYIIIQDEIVAKNGKKFGKKGKDTYAFTSMFWDKSAFEKVLEDGVISRENCIKKEEFSQEVFDVYGYFKNAITLLEYNDLSNYIKEQALKELLEE